MKSLFMLRRGVGKWIRLADRARDEKKWADAAILYEKAVGLKPELGGIWMQLGNVRKEAGDFAGSDNAYQTALKLMPSESDVALQIGHLRKVTGHTEEAGRWYLRALHLDSGNSHARLELSILDSRQLKRAMTEAVKVEPTAESIQTVWWDCSAVAAWRTGNIAFSSETMWFFELGRALAKSTSIQPVVFDAQAGEFVEFSFEEEALAGRKKRRVDLPKGRQGALIACAAASQSFSDWVRLLTAARRDAGMMIIGVVRARWIEPDIDNVYAMGELAKLRLLTRHAAVLMTREGEDREWLQSLVRETAMAQASVVTIDRTLFDVVSRQPVTNLSEIVVLAPESEGDWVSLIEQLKRIKGTTTRVSVVPVSGIVDAKVPGEPWLSVITDATAWPLIEKRGAALLVVPRHRADSEVWAEHALKCDVAVLSHARNHGVFDILGANAQYFIDGTDDAGIDALYAGSVEAESICGPWREILACITSKTPEYARATYPAGLIEYGKLYGFERPDNGRRRFSDVDGLELLAGDQWGATTTFGIWIKNDKADVVFTPEVDLRTNLTCRFIVYEVEPVITDQSWRVKRLFWQESIATTSDVEGSDVSLRYYASLDLSELSVAGAGARYAIGGVVVFPAELDYHWHEYLDRSSRSVYSFRNTLNYRQLS